MSRLRSILLAVACVLSATFIFWLVIHQVSGLWLDVALRPEVRQALEQSLDDQKSLRALDSAHREQYRRRFETTRTLLNRIDVIRMSRAAMLQRFELTLVGFFAFAGAVAATAIWARYRRAQVEERRDYLERITVLQQTARRQAHEIKGPLTAARLELERMGDLARRGAAGEEMDLAQQSVTEELERVSRFMREYASFAAIGAPVLQRISLRAAIGEFCSTFAQAWPGITLLAVGEDAQVCADRDLLRQVFVNLCTNSARASEDGGSVTFTVRRGRTTALDVSDTGSGIPESLRASVFDPYVTTRKMGEGMGLGLSISRKIMLDHGGDLELVETSSSGTTFRLTFGERTCN